MNRSMTSDLLAAVQPGGVLHIGSERKARNRDITRTRFAQRTAGSLFDAKTRVVAYPQRTASQRDDLSAWKHHAQPAHPRAGGAKAMTQRAGGVARHGAAQRAVGATGRVGRIEEPRGFHLAREVREQHPRLHCRPTGGRVDACKLIQPLGGKQPSARRHRTRRRARAPSDDRERRARTLGSRDDLGHLRLAARPKERLCPSLMQTRITQVARNDIGIADRLGAGPDFASRRFDGDARALAHRNCLPPRLPCDQCIRSKPMGMVSLARHE